MASNLLGLEVDWRGGVTGGSMGLAPQNSPAQCRIILIKKNTLGVEKKKSIQSKQNESRKGFFFFFEKQCATCEVGENTLFPRRVSNDCVSPHWWELDLTF